MKNVLLVNGAKAFANAGARLNASLQQVAYDTLVENGFNVEQTIIDDGYDELEEVEKYVRADIIIYQIPGFWMNAPWIVWEYFSKVFGAAFGKLCASDGRSRSDANKKYGSGGLSQNKKYMLSWTWNAPEEAFTDKEQFFGGVGIDGVSLNLHKTHEFLGMSALKTFACYDVVKDPQAEKYFKDYKEHILNEIVKK